MLSVAFLVVLPNTAEMIAFSLKPVTLVVIVNGGETEEPSAIVTEEGTCANPELLERVTTTPPVGAGPLSVMVLLVVEMPPAMADGERITAETVTGTTVTVAVNFVS
jgi:hypothetical protein